MSRWRFRRGYRTDSLEETTSFVNGLESHRSFRTSRTTSDNPFNLFWTFPSSTVVRVVLSRSFGIGVYTILDTGFSIVSPIQTIHGSNVLQLFHCSPLDYRHLVDYSKSLLLIRYISIKMGQLDLTFTSIVSVHHLPHLLIPLLYTP